MKITSDEFNNCDYIPAQYTCDGENVNPPLEFHDIPDSAVSLALIMDDPDAPNGDFVHWLAWDMPPETKEIDSDNPFPLACVCGVTSFGKMGYGGPCPPRGEEHRYFFKLYALDTMLDRFCSAKKPDLERAMEGHIIKKAELVGLYKRK